MTPAEEMERLAARAREAARAMSRARAEIKTRALIGLADQLAAREEEILTANRKDLDAARAAGLDAPRLDRLTLTPAIMAEMRAACLHVAQLPDPVGVTEQQWQQPNGLLVGRMRIPLGVIAMIYEARPNVTIDAAILCIKAGNAVVLRGGSEAFHSNLILAGIMNRAAIGCGLPDGTVQLVPWTDHAAVNLLLGAYNLLPVLPLDGGRMLLAALYLRLPEQTAWLIGRVWSLLVITCLLVLALWAAGRAGLLPLVMVLGLYARLALREKSVAFCGGNRYNK